MANYKKKNGHRKRPRFHGFRNTKNNARSDSWRLDSIIRRFIRQSSKVDEE